MAKNVLSTKFLALDLEMNQPSGRIIQVGISIGSMEMDWREFVTRQWIIDPKEPIDQKIVDLTGISDQTIAQHAVPHEQMAREISELIIEHEVFVNPITWGVGDSDLLLGELRDRHIEFRHFGHRWIDVKTLHVLTMLSQGKTNKGGLSVAMGKYKLSFNGKAHRADVDAMNTLRLFFHMMRRQRALESCASMMAGI